MCGVRLNRLSWLALRASAALLLTVAPYHLTIDGGAKIVPAGAHGESGGGEGGNGGGKGGDDHGDNSGHGGGKNNSGRADGKGEHVNPATGDKVELDANRIEVVHPDGIREEIENGRFEMKDALGRTIVERKATPKDMARLQAL